MKNYSILFITAVSIGLMSFGYINGFPSDEYQQQANEIDIPENVQAVLDRSCLPCHGPDGSRKARVKWKYENMPEYSKSKLVSKYIKISEKVDEGKMPPAKSVKKHPAWSLSAEDKVLLKTWAENAAEEIVGGKE
jgi:mono/diheme cytochrome c family protein